MKKFLVILMIIVSTAVFGQDGQERVDVKYNFSSEAIKLLWEEWEEEREEGKLMAVLFLHSLPFDIVSTDDYEELAFFYCLLLDDVALFNNIIYTTDYNLSIPLITRKMFSALTELPISDEDKLKSMKIIGLMKNEESF